MNALEILQKHPAGIKYGYILEPLPEYPVLMDSKGQVLAIPPIINSEETRIVMESPETKGTRNIFIDASGFDEKVLSQAINVIVTSLAERGGVVKSVTMAYPERKLQSPNLTPITMELRTEYTNNMIGLSLSPSEIVEYLEMMRLRANLKNEDLIEVTIPAYRTDFLHECDLVEEVAIAYGYDRLIPIMPNV
ncbi:MAG: hypothetical protein KAS38_00400, partial [Anaerolineales bacterium]|nr:hypothetical protein [Anaerolineales bacterium]